MNTSFIHADIFFYITTISVIILTALLIIFLYYVVKIVRHVEHTSKRLMEESDAIIDDVSAMRETIADNGGRFMTAVKFIFGSFIHSKFSSKGSAGSKSKTSRKK